MRSRITKRSQHTATHAHRIASLRRAARKLTGAYVAPGVFEAKAPARPRNAPADRLLAGGSATLWVVPSSPVTVATVSPALGAAAQHGSTAITPSPSSPRAPRPHTAVTACPVDWSAVRRYEHT